MRKNGLRAGRALGGAAALVLLTRCGAGPEPERTPPSLDVEQPASPDSSRCPAPDQREQTLAFEALADTYVEAHQAEAFGGSRKLVADSASERAAYLRFELTGLAGPVRRAELRLYALDPSIDGPALHPVDPHWEEATLTWRQPPAPRGPVAADVGPVADEAWVAYDVTALVHGPGVYAFGLFTHSRDGVDFASREHPTPELRPRLLVTSEVTCAGGAPRP